MYLPCQRSLQSLSAHTVDGQFVWRTGWEGENIIDLVYVDLWLHLELVNWLFLEVEQGVVKPQLVKRYIMRNRSVHIELYQLLYLEKKRTCKLRKKNKNEQLVEKMMMFLASQMFSPSMNDRGRLPFSMVSSTNTTLPTRKNGVVKADPTSAMEGNTPNGPPCKRRSDREEKPLQTTLVVWLGSRLGQHIEFKIPRLQQFQNHKEQMIPSNNNSKSNDSQ